MQNTNSRVTNQLSFHPEDLLDREPIVLDAANIGKDIANSKILITGAAGSIGSELAQQICTHHPALLILVDQAETALNDLDVHLRARFKDVVIQAFVASITDVIRMKNIFKASQPDIVFHAAAYKHVPFMERHPYEAMKTNIFGVDILARLAMAYQVSKFIFISTDKAVNPASVMGATKRVAEMYLQQLSKSHPSSTKFIITRFGNVLGSNGSVVLTFEQQIRAGGPVTITDPRVSRFMMTVFEACQLVLEASATGENGQILFFDMGKPVLIEDIARRMIRLAKQEIAIQYIGLRPGEKLHEELFDDHDDVSQSAKIKICRTLNKTLPARTMLNMLAKAMETGNDDAMLSALKASVPEFRPAKS